MNTLKTFIVSSIIARKRYDFLTIPEEYLKAYYWVDSVRKAGLGLPAR